MRVLQNLVLFPCKIRNLNEIINSERTTRFNFACRCQNKSKALSAYFSRTDFSDGGAFRSNGSVYFQNLKIRRTEHLIEGRRSFAHNPSVMLWLAGLKKALFFYFSKMRT